MVIRAPRAQRTFFGQSSSFGWSSRFHVVYATKENQEIFRTFLSSIKILNTALNILKKPGTDHCWRLRSELQTKQPFAMTQSLNRLRRFAPYGPFARSRKHDFPNIYIDDLLSKVFFINFSRYFGQGRRFLPLGTFTFPTSSIHVLLEMRSTMF